MVDVLNAVRIIKREEIKNFMKRKKINSTEKIITTRRFSYNRQYIEYEVVRSPVAKNVRRVCPVSAER